MPKKNKSLVLHIVKNYIISLMVFMTIFFIVLYAIYSFLHSRIWYESDPMYPLLHYIDDHHFSVFAISCLIGWLIISIIFIFICINHLKKVVRASELIVMNKGENISLPKSMKSIEEDLNYVTELAKKYDYIAKEAEQRKNDLVVFLAHDLKTPLTSIIGYLTLLCEEPDLPVATRAKYTNIALNKAERLESLINEFFEITRFNLTSISLDIETINLSLMLEQISNEFIPVMAEKALSCKLDIQPDIKLACDPNKLERVFDNLFRNAINYCYQNTTISINMEAYDNKVIINFENKGKTIPSDKLEKLFDQFFRIDSSRSTKTGNAGLGLAITKEIVELHKGTISVKSEDEITCFTITLPC